MDPSVGVFSLKPEIHPFWEKEIFREMVSDRVEYALNRYFHRRSQTLTVYFSKGYMRTGFDVEPQFAMAATSKRPLRAGESRAVRLRFKGVEYPASLSRSASGNKFRMSYTEEAGFFSVLLELFGEDSGSTRPAILLRPTESDRFFVELEGS